jgi:bifunctional DNase/RNase
MKREIKIVGLSYSHSQVGSYVCVIGEINGMRKIPIIIKQNDAQTISIKIEEMTTPRPLTHDLIKSISDAFQLDCQEIQIYNIMEGIFYCRGIFTDGIDDHPIEMSVGDAISLSLVYGCPFYAYESVLSSCGIETDQEGNILTRDQNVNEESNKDSQSDIISIEDLEIMLERAVQNEEYEMAAQYRNKIDKLKNK